ncbi:MAG TPA: 2OG-Fe(II) oxygenase, partial [Rhodanobacteraceae bacterium]|nr:2OG-Fe(II) oxygenase [Rhodanobacteraceae bacterium]
MSVVALPPHASMAARVRKLDWPRASADLDAQGFARFEGLLSARECRALASLYADDSRFRSRVVMHRHGFGRGEYGYFAYPLPPLVAALREMLYPYLRGVANRWNAAMNLDARYPPT